MSQVEDNKYNIYESVFYGYFLHYTWRDEKTGRSFFRISTKHKLLLDKQYQKKNVIRDKETQQDITWYTVNCDASHISTPRYATKTPVKITGYFKSDVENGFCWDFQITAIQEASEEETITIEYLASDSFPGISYEDAVTIVRFHGADIFSYVQTPGAAKKIQEETHLPASVVKDMIHIIGDTIEERKLYEFLGPIGIPYPYCAKAVKFYGSNALKKICSNPHRTGAKLGLSFSQCDAIAAKCGFRPDYEGRMRQAIRETVKKIANNGHVYASQEEYYRIFYRLLSSDVYKEYRPSLIDFFASAKKYHLGMTSYNRQECYYDTELVHAEQRIARNLIRLATVKSEEQPWSDDLIEYAQNACGMRYGGQQRAAFSSVLRNRGLKVVVGGPGTGKTTTIKGIIMAYQKMFPDDVVKLCAPTGRAAQRLAESTDMEASTVHRLLDYRPYGDSTTHKDANNPIQANLIVIDEMSMMDIELFDIFLSAVKSGTTLIFVGDTNQLEAVGAGAVLSDLMQMPKTLINITELTEVFRQKGGSPIIENSIRTKMGRQDLECTDDFQIINAKSPEQTRDIVCDLMKQLYNPNDPFETQILCPARKGEAGIDNLNILLQKNLNSGKKYCQYGRTIYRVNDKIMMTNNNYDSECLYYNGDIGIIKEITDTSLKVEIRGEILEIKKKMMESMDLSYGMTIHKSQGSEFQNVIVVMPMEPKGMLVRNLFYTAITRAKKRVFIINEGSAMETAIKTDKSSARRTTLLLQVRHLMGLPLYQNPEEEKKKE